MLSVSVQGVFATQREIKIFSLIFLLGALEFNFYGYGYDLVPIKFYV